jgi:hypothetical protein
MEDFMKRTAAMVLLVMAILSSIAFGQDSTSVLAQGQPPLTQQMVDRLAVVYETILDFKFIPAQRSRFQQGEIDYWIKRDVEGIKQSLDNLKYYGQTEQLAEMRTRKTQDVLIESLRRDIEATKDPVSIVIVEAFDRAHIDRGKATAPKGFSDLIGTWKRTDYLLAQRSPAGGQIGVGYTDSGNIEIMADGRFKLLKVHDYYAGSCSRQDAMTETGRLSVSGTKIVFQIMAGSRQTKDGCSGAGARTVIKPETASYTWSIRPNPNNERVTMLCINIDAQTAECYEKS